MEDATSNKNNFVHDWKHHDQDDAAVGDWRAAVVAGAAAGMPHSVIAAATLRTGFRTALPGVDQPAAAEAGEMQGTNASLLQCPEPAGAARGPLL
jgi:hypothetical protein